MLKHKTVNKKKWKGKPGKQHTAKGQYNHIEEMPALNSGPEGKARPMERAGVWGYSNLQGIFQKMIPENRHCN